jgi:hypothetical protein
MSDFNPFSADEQPEEHAAWQRQEADEQPDEQVSQFELAVREDLRKRRVRAEGEQRFKAEQHAATWAPPTECGTLAELLAEPDEPVSFRIAEVMPAGANVTLIAQYKTGKTTMVNSFVRSVVDGRPFLGKYAVERIAGRVGIFNYEVGKGQYKRWLRDIGIVHTNRVVPLNLRGTRLPIAVPQVEDWIIDWLKRNEVEVWILDPLARAVVGSAAENDNETMGVFFDTLDVIKARAGVKELLIPVHTGRAEQKEGQERARAATRIDDWPDARWILTSGRDKTRYVAFTGRDVEVEQQALAFNPETRDLTVEGGSRSQREHHADRADVLRHVADHPGRGFKEIAKSLSRAEGIVGKLLRELEKDGLIRTEKQGQKLACFITSCESTVTDDEN